MRMKIATCFLLIYCICPAPARAQQMTDQQIDRLAEQAMKAFDVPGIAIGIVKDGKLLYENGYGVRSLNTGEKVDTNTLFGIASNSKAFTAAALGILVDQGKLKWDDKVVAYIPEFQMYDPYVTADFTIRDLLTHRSGLPAGAGDLMHDPDSTNFTTEDIIRNMHYLKPVSPFRSKFAYNNNMYIIAGEIVARVSGMSWERFVERNIMAPLQMDGSSASYHGIKDKTNVIDAHASVDGRVKVIPRYASEICDPAGGVYSSVADMSKWVMMQLNDGKYGEGLNERLFSESVHNEMWTPQMVIPVGKPGIYNTHFGAYGLGWFLCDVKGYKQVFHTGQDVGMVSEIALIPELKLGIIVLTNQEEGEAFISIVDQITDGFLGVTGTDRVRENLDRLQERKQNMDKATSSIWKEVALRQKTEDISTDSTMYCGMYRDSWLGDVQITVINHQLWFISKRSPQLAGAMLSYKDGIFAIKWRNPAFNEGVLASFTLNEQGKGEGIRLKPISGLYSDFQNLDFHRVP